MNIAEVMPKVAVRPLEALKNLRVVYTWSVL